MLAGALDIGQMTFDGGVMPLRPTAGSVLSSIKFRWEEPFRSLIRSELTVDTVRLEKLTTELLARRLSVRVMPNSA